MNGKSVHWVSSLAGLGLAVGLTAGFAVAGAAQSVSGRAYSTYVNTPLGSSGYSPLAVLPAVSGTDGAEADAQGDALNVAGGLGRALDTTQPPGAVRHQLVVLRVPASSARCHN